MKRFGSFALDISNECLWRNGTHINLPPKPFAVLRFLVENPGRLITHDELLDALWPETYVQPQVLRTYVLELRKVLGDDLEDPRYIQTLPKRGYCFVAPIVDSIESQTAISSTNPALTPVPTGIVARDQELADLASHAHVVARGERQTIFVTGGIGIGKTALVDAFCHQFRAIHPALLARGQCIDGFALREDFYPIIEAVNQLCRASEGDHARRTLSAIAPAFVPAPARESKTIAASAPNHSDNPTIGNLCEALEELAREKPLILVLDDIQWADDSTLTFISALARRRAPTKLLVLATCRSRDVSTNLNLKMLQRDLLMRGISKEIVLSPLAKSDIRKLLARELRQEILPPDLDDFVYGRSEGNPLFALALLEHLIAERFLVREGKNGNAGWAQQTRFSQIEIGVPARIEQMISLEIERLTPEQQRILECASLLHIAFPAWVVAAALEGDAIAIEAACDELANQVHFVHRAGYDDLPDGSRSAFFVFSHGLYREVLHQRQGAAVRSVRHNRIAERLGNLFGKRQSSVAREMAMHYEEAGNWARAVKSLRSAARHAQQRRAHSEAVQLLEQALRVADNIGGPDHDALATEIHHELKTVADTHMGPEQTGLKNLDKLWTGT